MLWPKAQSQTKPRFESLITTIVNLVIFPLVGEILVHKEIQGLKFLVHHDSSYQLSPRLPGERLHDLSLIYFLHGWRYSSIYFPYISSLSSPSHLFSLSALGLNNLANLNYEMEKECKFEIGNGYR